jgi:hypothetical protein
VGGISANSDFSFARYTHAGKLDSSFGKNGKVSTDLTGTSALGQILVHQHRLYAIGSLTFGPDESYGVVAAYQLEVPEPAVSIADVTVPESQGFAVVTVRLSRPSTQTVTVNFTTRDGTARQPKDYIAVSYPVLIAPGFRTSEILIPIVNDNKPEGPEQFEVVLTDALNATIRDSVGVVTIVDDDAPITKQKDSLRINASPNPFVSTTTIQLQGGNDKEPVSIRLYDMSGRIIEERSNISTRQRFQLADQYKAGTYIIEAIQGTQRVQQILIKSGR